MNRLKRHTRPPRRFGLGYWMQRVLRECRRAGRAFDADPVHDLRVALRRCRSLAGGLMQMDPHPDWRAMRKAGRRIFRRLGRLRDVQVMTDWVRKLAPPGDAVRGRLLSLLAAEEQAAKEAARAALAEFPAPRWQRWAKKLPRRAARLPLDSAAFQHLALERWQEAYDLHHRATRIRSRKSLHELRIGLKRFRYTVENFLPSRAGWLPDLKRLQDLLGDAHDLDVLRGRFFTRRRLFSEYRKAAWRKRIEAKRARRLLGYRRRMIGRQSLWRVWRAALPQGAELERAGLARLAAWAGFLDPHFGHSRRVARVALQLLEGLAPITGSDLPRDARARRILQAAALLRNIGRVKGARGHHKRTYRMICECRPPLGWTAAELRRTALVARYHRGAEPRASHPGFAGLPPAAQRRVLWLAAVLRLADGIAHGAPVRQARLEVNSGAVFLWVQGYPPRRGRHAAALLADRKHLLESLLKMPVIVRPA